MIAVKELTKIYGQQRAIDAIGFQIGAGEIVGFLGPNGAGKTTTMKIITCFMPPSSGTVEVDGLNIHEHSLDIRKRIGYLPEHNPLYLDMYVHEYLRFVGRLYHMGGAALGKRVQEIIDMTGLGREQHKKIGMLSKGYRQRVGLSQALIHNPDILILDEPTTGLDPNQIVEIRSLIREIGKSKTVIFSTHILPEVEAIANRVIIIHRGHIVADESMEGLRQRRDAENVWRVSFDKPGFQTAPVTAVGGEVVAKQVGGNGRDWEFISGQGTDIRKALLEQSLAQGNPISNLHKKEDNLEEVFRSLTKA
ncbi:MAG: ATP-binding cassette domain-containing protein [Bacteroidia bacterium]